MSAVDYAALTSSAANVIQPNWTSCATIVGVEAWNCTLVDKHANVMKDFKKYNRARVRVKKCNGKVYLEC